ncbi:MAG: hypothetical protein KAR13_03700 [Desulfobulbaceae bacterium]|nr:hypothetical protein [Desulfobulbaceae bacterium]
MTIIDILPLNVLIGLVPILILLAILRNSIDRRINKKPQVQNTTAVQEKENLQKTLTPEAVEVLRVIAATLSPFGNNRQEATIDKIALSETFRMSHQQTERLFELLEKAGTLETNDIGIYGITGEGRKLLNEKEKMP